MDTKISPYTVTFVSDLFTLRMGVELDLLELLVNKLRAHKAIVVLEVTCLVLKVETNWNSNGRLTGSL